MQQVGPDARVRGPPGRRGRRQPHPALLKYVPGLRWLLGYDVRRSLAADLIAGVTVGVMAVPQSAAFAGMAGLPAAFGLYCCLVPPLVYALFGGSRFLAVGPVALVSLVLSSGLREAVPNSTANTNPNRPADPEAQAAYNRAAVQVSLLAGLLLAALAAARLGWACALLSRPIVSAFLTAGALLISLSQAQHLAGLDLPRGGAAPGALARLAAALPRARPAELALGCLWLALLAAARAAPRWHRSLARVGCLGPVTVAALSIALAWAGGLDASGAVATVGRIRPGPPPLTLAWLLPARAGLGALARTAGAVVLVALLEAVSIAKALGERAGDRVDPALEIRALAACNLAGAAFASYPATGSFARSAVACDSGAQTGAAGVVTAAVVGGALLLATPAFARMPLGAMAAIVIVGVLGLLDFRRAAFYWRVSKVDFAVWAATFLTCLLAEVDAGLLAGIALQLLALFGRTAFARAAVLPPQACTLDPRGPARRAQRPGDGGAGGRLEPDGSRLHVPGTARACEGGLPGGGGLGEGAAPPAGLLVVRPEGPLCFANVQALQDQAEAALAAGGRCQDGAGEAGEEEAGLMAADWPGPAADLPGEELGLHPGARVGLPDRLLVLDLGCSFFMDATAAEALVSWQQSLRKRHVRLGLLSLGSQPHRICSAVGLLDSMGSDCVFGTLQEAARACDRLAAGPAGDPQQ